jgi:hypothetical protein
VHAIGLLVERTLEPVDLIDELGDRLALARIDRLACLHLGAQRRCHLLHDSSRYGRTVADTQTVSLQHHPSDSKG